MGAACLGAWAGPVTGKGCAAAGPLVGEPGWAPKRSLAGRQVVWARPLSRGAWAAAKANENPKPLNPLKPLSRGAWAPKQESEQDHEKDTDTSAGTGRVGA